MSRTLTFTTAAAMLAWAALASHPAVSAEAELRVAAVDARQEMAASSDLLSSQATGPAVTQEFSSSSDATDRWPAGASLFGLAFFMLARLARKVEPPHGRPPDAAQTQQRAQLALAEHKPQRSADASPAVADRRRRAD